MGEIRTVLYWMSGIVTQSIPAVLADVLRSREKKAGNLNALPGFPEALEKLVIGQSSDLEFLQAFLDSTGLESSREQLRSEILARFMPDPPALQMIDILPDSFERWLVVDLPPAWYAALYDRLDLSSTFSPERTIFLGLSELPRLVPDLFYYLSRRVQQPAQRCLLFDPSVKRAIQGINHQFPTAHYVNPRLLEREFYLRGMIGKVIIHKKPELTL
jgi:hypothetical protein